MSELIDTLLEKARAAQKVVEFWTQEQVDEMILSVGWESYKLETAQRVARLAVDETGLGVYEDKVAKHQKKTLGVLRDLKGVKTVGIIERIPEKGIVKIAKPVGVIGAITPMTNSSSTMPCNGLPALAARNAIIFDTSSARKENLRRHRCGNAQGTKESWRTRRPGAMH